MYLALRPPWAGHATAAAPTDAAVVASAPSDAGVKKPKPRRHHAGGGNPNAGGAPQSGDDPGWGGSDTITEVGPQLVQLSAGDRALEWRGDDTSPPAQKIDMTSDARSLSQEEIQGVISSQSGGVGSCVVQAATNTDLKGTITVRMIVDGSGHVTKSKLQAPKYLLDHGVLACSQHALAKMKFPSTGAQTLVTMPIELSVTN
jgi:hypothetical protein